MTPLFRESLGRLTAALRGPGAIESASLARASMATSASKAKKKAPPSKPAGRAAAASPRSKSGPSGKTKATVIKRAPSAYGLFMKHEYASLRKAQPDISFGDATKRIADMWKQVPLADKSRYINESAKLKQAVEAEKRRVQGPKRPVTAYASYMQEMYPKVKARYPGEKLPDISRRVGEMWTKMGATEKQQRMKKAEQARAEFDAKYPVKK